MFPMAELTHWGMWLQTPTLTTFYFVLNKIIDKIAQFASIMQFLVK